MFELKPQDYYKVANLLHKVEFNTYFAKSVVDNRVSGKIYTNSIENPTVFYIYHPYGMGLLLGDYNDVGFVESFKNYCLNTQKQRTNPDWLQVYPLDWCSAIDRIKESTDSLIESYERVNFRFSVALYAAFRKTIDLSNYDIIQTNVEVFETMPGTVVPRLFWNNATDFMHNAIGFTLLIDHQPISTAFASFRMDDILEIGIQTIDGLQGKGYSAYTCCRLIDYCIENGLTPLWSCKKDNIGSMKLAQKLGFEVSRTGPYYKIGF